MDKITEKTNNKILLWNDKPEGYLPGDEIPCLIPFLIPGSSGCVIVCAGGAYQSRSKHESEDVAKELNTQGISAFVLEYRVAPSKHPAQLYDVLRAIRYARYLSVKDSSAYYNSDKIAVMGFSAGGHLATMAAQHFDNGRCDGDEIDKNSSRPDAVVLCYPVVSLLDYTHKVSRYNLLGRTPSPTLTEKLSGELSVRQDMPPVFAWHTADDASVNVMNSIMLCGKLAEFSIPFELHVFPCGRHGLGLGKESTMGVDVWFSLLCKFLSNRGW